MTYAELAHKISEMTDYQKNCDVTVFEIRDQEYFKANLLFEEDGDVLDKDHPFLIMYTEEEYQKSISQAYGIPGVSKTTFCKEK